MKGSTDLAHSVVFQYLCVHIPSFFIYVAASSVETQALGRPLWQRSFYFSEMLQQCILY